MALSAKDASFSAIRSHPSSLALFMFACHPVSCGGVCEEGAIAAAHVAIRGKKKNSREQGNMLPMLFVKLSRHWFPGVAIFPDLKSLLEEQALKSSAALYLAHLEGIQRHCGTYVSAEPCLPCSCVFASPFDQSLCSPTWPLFWACLSLLSPGPAPHLCFWHMPLKFLCFPLRRRKAALLRYQHLGFLLQPFLSP